MAKHDNNGSAAELNDEEAEVDEEMRRDKTLEDEARYRDEKRSREKKKERRRHGSRSRSRSRSRRRRTRSYDSDSESSSSGSDYSDSELSGSVSETDSEEERRRKRRREKRRRREKEEEKERRRRKKEKEKKRRKEKEKKKKEKDLGKKGAVTSSWGKYGVIRETDMWNKRPEFTAWLSEVKQVNLEQLSNWEEKQMFKGFMEDHNTATFPSKKYYDLDAYHRKKMEKEQKKGLKKAVGTERTEFNDEEQRRIELLRERERQKEEEVEALKRSMQTGMAQAMKEQARLREEMMFQYKLGNHEAAAAIQRRLDPDAPLQ